MLSRPKKQLANSLSSIQYLNRSFYFFRKKGEPKNSAVDKSKELTKDKNEPLPNPAEESKGYVYDRTAFNTVNSSSFVERLRKIEQKQEETQRMKSYSWYSLKVPFFLTLGALFIYHCWQTVPYNVVFKHATLSEYVNREKYLHAIFVSSLSFQTTGHLITYLPLMLLSFNYTSKYLKPHYSLGLFLGTSIATTATTYLYEKVYKKHKFLIPKCNGAVTPLAFSACFLALNPSYMILGSRLLPYFIIPATYYMYEYYEFLNNYVNEICRPSHFAAIFFGLAYGLLMRRMIGL